MCVDKWIWFEYATHGQGNFKSGEKKLQIQNYPDTCGQGLNLDFEIKGPQDTQFFTILLLLWVWTSLQAKINYYQWLGKLLQFSWHILHCQRETCKITNCHLRHLSLFCYKQYLTKVINPNSNQHHAAMQTYCLLNKYCSFYKS